MLWRTGNFNKYCGQSPPCCIPIRLRAQLVFSQSGSVGEVYIASCRVRNPTKLGSPLYSTMTSHHYISVYWLMAVEVHTFLADVQRLRTSIRRILFRTSDKCNMRRDSDFFLTRSSFCHCSAYLYWEVDFSAGQLVCHHRYQGMLP